MRVMSEALAENFQIVAVPNVGVCLYLVVERLAKLVTPNNGTYLWSNLPIRLLSSAIRIHNK